MINDLKLHDTVCGDFILDNCEICTSKNNKQYGRVTISDASGTICGNMWSNYQQLLELHKGDIVRAHFSVESYLDVLQAKITYIAKQDSSDVKLDELIPASPYDCDNMLAEVIDIAKKIEDADLSRLVCFFFSDPAFLKQFRWHPAAATNHHNFIGGLLQHTLSVTKLAISVADLYGFVCTDLVVTVSLLHDIGKLHELQSLPIHGRTMNGHLIGHVVESQNMVRDACQKLKDFPRDKMECVCHCILSHHGELEYGSPVKPKLVEGYIVHMCDNIDAHVEIFHRHLEENRRALDNGFTSINRLLGVNITEWSSYSHN